MPCVPRQAAAAAEPGGRDASRGVGVRRTDGADDAGHTCCRTQRQQQQQRRRRRCGHHLCRRTAGLACIANTSACKWQLTEAPTTCYWGLLAVCGPTPPAAYSPSQAAQAGPHGSACAQAARPPWPGGCCMVECGPRTGC